MADQFAILISSTVHYKNCRSEGKRTSVRKKTTDPQFHDDFMLNIPVGVPLLECIIRISAWHQTLLADDTFLGQVCTSVCYCCY